MSGTLYVVATPIGNLDDLSPRARQTLAAVDIVAAEDTRRTGRLLSHIGVSARLLALHDHNENSLAAQLIEKLQGGESIALVSDAGTPLVSDPGYRLVHLAHRNAIAVSPVPGPCALTAALSVAGLPTDRFVFHGFLPAKQKARLDALQTVQHETATLGFYESVHRIGDTLADMQAVLGERPAFLGRELTKMHEQCVSGSLVELGTALHDGRIPRKGEFVVLVSGAAEAAATRLDEALLLSELGAVLSPKQAAAIAAKLSGGRRNEYYQRLLASKNK